MKNEKQITLYNLILPIWLLVFFPTWLWLFLIPANYLLDRVVLRCSLGKMPEKGRFCRKHTWKICLVGFAGDLIGVAVLMALLFVLAYLCEAIPHMENYEDILGNAVMNPFGNLFSFLIVAAVVFLAGLFIYLMDRRILGRAGLDRAQAKKSAGWLAVITAPYLFFLPTALLYDANILSL